MFDTTQSVVAYLEAVLPEFIDAAGSYGEPGYRIDSDATTPLVVLGSYWCRCGTIDDMPTHDIARHYPQTFERLESQGVIFEWYDEWIIDSEHDKAYRQSEDSYSWRPSFVVTDHGDMLTPDDSIDEWIAWATDGDEPRCIPSHIYDGGDLESAGFTKWNGTFENGWYPGQDDDPKAITTEIRKWHTDDTEVVFTLDDKGQFDIQFSAYWRTPPESLARELGREHGTNAAAWWRQDAIGGRTTGDVMTYARQVLEDLDDGNPSLLDSLPSPDLSGKWADGPTPQSLAEHAGIDPRDGIYADELCNVYEAAFNDAVHAEVARMCREVLS